MTNEGIKPSLADELFPIPQAAKGEMDSLAIALRRSAAVAVIVVFLLAIVFYILTEPEHGPEVEAAHELRKFLWRGREFVIVLEADR